MTYDYNPKKLQTHQLYGAQANKIVRMSKKNVIVYISTLEECLNNDLL